MKMHKSSDSASFADLFELLEFSLCEAQALRSFLEYLRFGDDPPERKLARVQQWPMEISFEMGKRDGEWKKFSQSLKGRPPEQRAVAVRRILSEADSRYHHL